MTVFGVRHLELTYDQDNNGRRVWLEITDLDMGPKSSESSLELDLGSNDGWFQPFQIAAHLTDGAYLSHEEKLMMWLRTGDEPLGRGYKAIYKSVNLVHEERIINLSNVSTGVLLHLNYPSPPPPHVDYIEHLVAPLGSVILLELYRVILSEEPFCPGGAGVIEVSDNYADMNGTWWFLCEDSVEETLAIASFLNTIHVRQRSEQFGVRLNGTIQGHFDTNYKLKLLRGSEESSVESCLPNPCQNGGKCLSSGSRRTCQCTSHFTGMFCALTLCELEPCLFGQCQLTATSYTCNCQAGYIGTTCDQKRRPCADNPCEGRGECVDKTDNTFLCRCHAWWEG
ncbi:unnamed protein product, partial [Timema podura]|nr:unnamed protein product [Timema podura]